MIFYLLQYLKNIDKFIFDYEVNLLHGYLFSITFNIQHVCQFQYIPKKTLLYRRIFIELIPCFSIMMYKKKDLHVIH